MDRAAIEAAARDMGIVPGDPAYPFVQFMLRSAEANAVEHQEHEARLVRLLDRAEQQASGQLARAAVAELPIAIKQAVLQQFRLWAVAGGVGLVLAVGAGIGVGWWYRGDTHIVAGVTGGAPRCDDNSDGSRLCWIPVYEWTAPPHAAAQHK